VHTSVFAKVQAAQARTAVPACRAAEGRERVLQQEIALTDRGASREGPEGLRCEFPRPFIGAGICLSGIHHLSCSDPFGLVVY